MILLDHLKIGYQALEGVAHEHFNLEVWQSDSDGATVAVAEDAKTFYECGMTACAGGHLTFTSYWKAWGGDITSNGEPMINNELISETGVTALLHFYLDTEGGVNLFHLLRTPLVHIHNLTGSTKGFYGLSCDESLYQITPEQVQEKLALLYFICCVLGIGKHGYYAADGTPLNPVFIDGKLSDWVAQLNKASEAMEDVEFGEQEDGSFVSP